MVMNIFWSAAMVVFIVAEAATVGLVSIWFAAGALAALIASLLGGPLWLQIVLFIAVSVAALLLTRPLARKYVNTKVQATNADRILGHTAVVTERIDNVAATGAVQADGKEWTARTQDDAQTVEQGARVVVERIEGVRLIVRPE